MSVVSRLMNLNLDPSFLLVHRNLAIHKRFERISVDKFDPVVFNLDFKLAVLHLRLSNRQHWRTLSCF